jgi:hypothetical protein
LRKKENFDSQKEKTDTWMPKPKKANVFTEAEKPA